MLYAPFYPGGLEVRDPAPLRRQALMQYVIGSALTLATLPLAAGPSQAQPVNVR
ncbi:MAG: hypothetical protein NT160_05240 [Actinobacteria bacterium]|nr:hypothetical protein [Actinomycetota bacterium]